MTDPVILFVAAAHVNDISIARREPDGTLRRAEYANINWLQRLSADDPTMVSLNPTFDLQCLNHRMMTNLAYEYHPLGAIDLTHVAAGYFRAMRRYHGSDFPLEIAEWPDFDLKEISNALGVPPRNYDPDKNSTNRLNWTMRLWERTRD